MKFRRARDEADQPDRRRRMPRRRTLIVGGAVGATILTATYPAVGFPVSVGAAVLGALLAYTRKDD